MADIDFFYPSSGEVILATHDLLQTRSTGLTGVVNGNRLTATSPNSMNIDVGAGRIRVAGLPIDSSAGVAVIGVSHATLNRIDIIIRDTSGEVLVVPGTLAAIEDLKGLGNWHQYTSPKPTDDVPDGAILGAVFVAATAAALSDDDIWMFAGPVGDIKTEAENPGVDTMPLSEKATFSAFAALDEDGNVVQDPANASAEPGANKIVKAREDGTIDPGYGGGISVLEAQVFS